MDVAVANSVPTFGIPIDQMKKMKSATMNERVGRYFLRFNTEQHRLDVVRSLELVNVFVEKHAEQPTDGSGGGIGQRCIVTGLAGEHVVMPIFEKEHDKIQGMIRVEGPW